MNRIVIFVHLLLLFPAEPEFMFGQNRSEEEAHRSYSPFTDIGRNTANCFTGSSLALQASAIGATALIVQSDLDYRSYKYFASHPEWDPYSTPAVYAGYLVPVLLGGGLWLQGLVAEDSRNVAAGSAVLQATLVSSAYIALLKAITGRPSPDPAAYSDMKAASRTFRFGVLNGGIHYGWPSGHLGVNTAAVVSLLYIYHESVALKVAGCTYLAYLAWSVAAHGGGQMHWLSDIVAGFLIGVAIGASVGSGFHDAWHEDTGSQVAPGTTVRPLIGPQTIGLQVRMSF